jgi:CheY-like chemotaxis protein
MNERILVVDDTPDNIQALSGILRGAGYQLSIATNGMQALDVLSRIRPALILLDVMMPGIDGFETCNRIKKNCRLQCHTGNFPHRQDRGSRYCERF